MLSYKQDCQKRIRKIKDVSNSIMYLTSGKTPTKNHYYNGLQRLWVTRFGVIGSRQ